MARNPSDVLAFLRRVTEPMRSPVRTPASRAVRRDMQAELDERGGLSRADALRLAMNTATKVWVDSYERKRDGADLEYTLRPYEVKPHPSSGRMVLYAQCHKHGGQIHSFLLSRMGGVENRLLANFAPRWPTRPESV